MHNWNKVQILFLEKQLFHSEWPDLRHKPTSLVAGDIVALSYLNNDNILLNAILTIWYFILCCHWTYLFDADSWQTSQSCGYLSSVNWQACQRASKCTSGSIQLSQTLWDVLRRSRCLSLIADINLHVWSPLIMPERLNKNRNKISTLTIKMHDLTKLCLFQVKFAWLLVRFLPNYWFSLFY